MFRFENAAAFSYLWLLPVALFCLWLTVKKIQKKLRAGLSSRVIPFLTSSMSIGKKKLKVILQILAFTLLVFALARPQLGVGSKEVKSEGVELVLMIDVSNSMLAQDVRPSRLEFAKKELMRLLDMLGGDKVGLVAFAGSAILMTPMTPDKSAIKLMLENVSTESVTNQGTSFERGLSEAWETFKRLNTEDEESHATRVIVIASDGEDHEPGALALAEKLVDNGIRIFTVAFGTEDGAPVPLSEESEGLGMYKKDRSGQQVISKVKGDALKKLAEMGKGSFYQASLSTDTMAALSSEIHKLDKTQFDSLIQTEYDEKFQWFLAFAIVLAMIELALGERKTGSVIWRGRFGGAV